MTQPFSGLGMGNLARLSRATSRSAFWYQTEPHAPFLALPAHEKLEVS